MIYLFVILIVALLGIPFVAVSNIYDGNILGGFYYLMFIGSVFALSILLISFFRKAKYKIILNFPDLAIISLFIFAGIRLIFTPIWQAYIGYFFLLWILLIIYLFVKNLFSNTAYLKQQFIIILGILFTGVIEIIIGFYQYFDISARNSKLRINGTFENQGPYTNYLVLIIVFAYGVFLLMKFIKISDKIIKWLAFIVFTAGTVLLALTDARTSWLALVLGLIVINFPFLKDNVFMKQIVINRAKRIMAICIICFVIFACAIGLYLFKPLSAKGRLLIYQTSMLMVIEKPIWGFGFCRFPSEYNNYQAKFLEAIPSEDIRMLASNNKVAFNEFIQFFVELGIIGFLLLILIFYLMLFSKTNGSVLLSLPARGSMATLAVCCLFSYPFHCWQSTVNLAIIAAILSSAIPGRQSIMKIHKSYRFAIIGIITLVIWICNKSVNEYKARVKWFDAIGYTKTDEFEKAIHLYNEAYPVLKYDPFFLFNYGAELLVTDPTASVCILEKATSLLSDSDLFCYLGDGYKHMKDYEKAEECYLLSIKMVPNKFFPRYQLFNLYKETGQFQKAFKIARSIASMKIKIQSETIDIIKNEVQQWLDTLAN